jgi:hypothetical protein
MLNWVLGNLTRLKAMPEDQVQYDEELAEGKVLNVHLSAQAQARVNHSLYHQLTEHRKDNG